jgi:uncharacterized protein (UPF0332 family)
MTPDQEQLLRKAYESLLAARVLEREEMYDFSASRSYYAMFYAVQALLLTAGLSFSKHAAVIAAFGREFAKQGIVPVEFHRYLIEAQEDRNVGDYGIGPGISADEAREQIMRAEELIRVIEERVGPAQAPES